MKRKYSVKDFKASSLPDTRKAQFKDVLSVNFGTIAFTGLIALLGFLPTYLAFILENNVLNDINATTDFGNYFIWSSIFGGVRILTLGIFFLVLGGISNVLKVLCFQDGLFFRQDFFEGVKDNWKHFVLTGILLGTFLLILDALQMLSMSNSGTAILQIAYYAYFGLFVVFILTIALMLLFMTSIYECSYGRHIANSAILSIKHLFPMVLFSIFLFVSYLILWIPLFVVQAILVALYFVLLFPIFLLSIHLYCLSIADEDINKDYPEILKKGLYKGE